MGRIVIETNPETGLTEVELTMDDGKTLKFTGSSDSELKYVDPPPDFIEVGDQIRSHKVPGLKEPAHWRFTIEVDNIPTINEVQ